MAKVNYFQLTGKMWMPRRLIILALEACGSVHLKRNMTADTTLVVGADICTPAGKLLKETTKVRDAKRLGSLVVHESSVREQLEAHPKACSILGIAPPTTSPNHKMSMAQELKAKARIAPPTTSPNHKMSMAQELKAKARIKQAKQEENYLRQAMQNADEAFGDW